MFSTIKTDELFNPRKLWERDELLKRGAGVPQKKGIYAWYFKTIPIDVPFDNCIKVDDFTLLYIGIAPVVLLSNNKLRNRLRNHFKGNASGSTLRLSLGCLLAQELNLQLQKTGSTGRLTFGLREQILTEWMKDNCRVAWLLHDSPWEIESGLLLQTHCPLNIKGNSHHPFASELTKLRSDQKSLGYA